VLVQDAPDLVVHINVFDFEQAVRDIIKEHSDVVSHVLERARAMSGGQADWSQAKVLCVGGCIHVPAVRKALHKLV